MVPFRSAGRDRPETHEAREWHSLDVEEAAGYGVEPSEIDNIGLFWGAQVWSHELVLAASVEFCPAEHYKSLPLQADKKRYERAVAAGEHPPRDPNNQAMTAVNIYTYRTREYGVSRAQDYRKGRPGFQQHIWQATLGRDANVYSTNPGAPDTGTSRPDY
jgi:hypothetical protein